MDDIKIRTRATSFFPAEPTKMIKSGQTASRDIGVIFEIILLVKLPAPRYYTIIGLISLHRGSNRANRPFGIWPAEHRLGIGLNSAAPFLPTMQNPVNKWIHAYGRYIRIITKIKKGVKFLIRITPFFPPMFTKVPQWLKSRNPDVRVS